MLLPPHISAWYRERPLRAWVWTICSAVLLLALMGGAAVATDSPDFCTTCHEMTPFGEAWASGPHAGVPCIDCHAGTNHFARTIGKFGAADELWVYLTRPSTFPLTNSSGMEDARCTGCHRDVQSDVADFIHDEHAARGACADCHEDTGHAVTDDSLRAAGLLNAGAAARKARDRVAVSGGGANNIDYHPITPCADCHDMLATGCGSCHEATGGGLDSPPHNPRNRGCDQCHTITSGWDFVHPSQGTCEECHEKPARHQAYSREETCSGCHRASGETWKFTHAAGQPCEECHVAPAGHREGPCAVCHAKAGESWAFGHPGPSTTCEECHARPAQHRAGSCGACHVAGVSWAFDHSRSTACDTCHTAPANHHAGTCRTCHASITSWRFAHPGSNSSCPSCHERPAGHSMLGCLNCHAVGKAWVFRHPPSGTLCTSCHTRPARHSSQPCGSCHTVASWDFKHPQATSRCTTCHKAPGGHASGECSFCHGAGASWDFRHTHATNCEACHSAPSNHPTRGCASCHTYRRPWREAIFTHPKVANGAHTYKSYSCNVCHPNGYASSTCKPCH